ncbi:16S rRNA (guanine(527)-N(7))-methyltransferase RsmG [Pseudogracilibacillus sp. SO30301A]|uniref:16S rRNA (guanine(527)-N(7))-methyltransferase RsmG n=1 Tax=Pseudogracilibacillus sp. SO30301A TaxID=3098291 RepID=UPI00300E1A86
MDEKKFMEVLAKKNLRISDQQLNQFKEYYQLLVEWNGKVNLTAITEKGEVFLKHFYDSLTASFYYSFKDVNSVCDIGAGAGFPSIPLKICYPHLKVTIVDSLNKRINFLKQLKETLQLDHVDIIHSRAEDIGQNKKYRENFDVVTARAVARLSVLSEYCLPLCKVGGAFIALKGANSNEELVEAKKALKILGGEVVKNNTFSLPIENSERSIIVINKIKKTAKMYPRKAGTPAKDPI